MTTIFELLLVILGFSLIIFLHELGHFVAARWAGIRVLAFAMGFGPALFSYRKGLGLRRGSSEAEYLAALRSGDKARALSPTEYRWNALPLGGYVKMLGQEDNDPTATSDAPDSFNMCPPVKRLVVISAGVVMNLITAAVLFVIVFLVGLKTEAPAVGVVAPGSPAARAVPSNAEGLAARDGQTPSDSQSGLRPADVILSVNGEQVLSFKDIIVGVAMAPKATPLNLVVQRPGIDTPLRFAIVPEMDKGTRLLSLGIGPASSSVIYKGRNAEEDALIQRRLTLFRLADLPPGSTLRSVGGVAAATPYAIVGAADRSKGASLTAEFESPAGKPVIIHREPETELQAKVVDLTTPIGSDEVAFFHLAGFVPVLKVADASEAAKLGLKDNDVFVRINSVPYPSMIEGIAEIRQSAGKSVAVTVLREGKTVDLGNLPVSSQGRLGFALGTADDLPITARWPSRERFSPVKVAAERLGDRPTPYLTDAQDPAEPPAARLALPPGSRIISVAGKPITDYRSLRLALGASASARQVEVSIELPATAAAPASITTQTLSLSKQDAEVFEVLGWRSPIPIELFAPREVMLRADSPLGALSMGLHETKRAMLQTYITFARLFQGTVKVEHLSGPVGIASAGVAIADKGFIWLLFFMGVISINLAVVNFLPLPIVDGGHFVYILYEQFTGRPVPPAFQNVAALVGLALIGSMFLIVTYNDLAKLLWR